MSAHPSSAFYDRLPAYVRTQYCGDYKYQTDNRKRLAHAVIAEQHAPYADDKRALDELAETIAAYFLRLELEANDDPFAPDEEVARVLDGIGRPESRALAERIRSGAAERKRDHDDPIKPWRFMESPDPLIVRELARVLWLDVVRPNRAALGYSIHEDVWRFHSHTFKAEDRDGQRLMRFDDVSRRIERVDAFPLPLFAAGVLEAMLDRGLDKLGSVQAHKLLRWEVFEGHRRALAGEPDARALDIKGGFAALAEKIGVDPGKYQGDIHAIVLAQAHCVFILNGGRAMGNMLSYTIAKARGRRTAHVRLILGDALLPYYVKGLRQSDGTYRSTVEASRLVPIVELPPFVGGPNAHGSQATMSMAVIAQIRANARDLVLHGGVQVNMGAVAARAGVGDAMVPRIVDRWTQDGTDGPAFLKRVGATRFTLGDAHQAARAFIEDAGQTSLDAAERARARDRERKRKRR